MADNDDVEVEERKVDGGNLPDRVKEILRDGSVKRLIIKKGERVLLDVPVAAGIGGAAAAVWFLPQLTAIGLAVAMLSDVRVIVHRATGETETKE